MNLRTAAINRTRVWTAEDYLMLGEMKTPCQLINGELITSPAPAPQHQRISRSIFLVLEAARANSGELFFPN